MMGIGSNQARRTPVPLCGGGHSEAFKLQCPECRADLRWERMAKNSDLQTYILEQMLDEGIKPKRTKWPSSSYTTPPAPQTTQQYGKKGGISIGPGRSGSG